MNVRSIMAAAAIIVTIFLDYFIVVVRTEPVWVLIIWLVLVRNAKPSFPHMIILKENSASVKNGNKQQSAWKTTDLSFKCAFIFSGKIWFFIHYNSRLDKIAAVWSVLGHFSGTGLYFVTPFVQKIHVFAHLEGKQKNIVDASYFLVTQLSQSYYGLGASTWHSCLI